MFELSIILFIVAAVMLAKSIHLFYTTTSKRFGWWLMGACACCVLGLILMVVYQLMVDV